MILKPIWIIYFLVVYIPFEEALLLMLPLPAVVYNIARLFSEVLVYLLLILVIINKLIIKKGFEKTRIDFLLVLFLCIILLSVVINNSNVILSIISVRPLLRFIALFYIIVNIRITNKQLFFILQLIVFMGVIQGIIAVSQFFSPSINSYFSSLYQSSIVRETSSGLAKSFAAEKVGAALGTVGSSSVLASFLLTSLTILFTSRSDDKLKKLYSKLRHLIYIIIIVIGIFSALKRGLLFLIPIIYLYVQWISNNKKTLLYSLIGYSFVFCMLVPLYIGSSLFDTNFQNLNSRTLRTKGVDLSNFFTALFTSEYWEKTSEVSRGWVIIELGGYLVHSVNLLGYSPDLETAKSDLIKESPIIFGKLETFVPIEDVYWVAMLLYYGIAGLIIFLMVIYRLYKYASDIYKSVNSLEGIWLSRSFMALIIVLIFSGFIYRVLEFRPFSFYFWLLAGLVVNYSKMVHRKTLNI